MICRVINNQIIIDRNNFICLKNENSKDESVKKHFFIGDSKPNKLVCSEQ